ncbi:MAG: DUF2490 domain-containing protein [Chryseotalea sp.]|jgi:hypothetical protein
MFRFYITITCCCWLLSLGSKAQTNKSIKANQQIWFGYMTSAPINSRYSLWNDFHFVPKGFWVARTGITRNWDNVTFTGGFAYLGLPVSANNKSLKRNEYRPWAQITWNTTTRSHLSFNTRIRYDARFRQKVLEGELTDDYPFTNRMRLAFSARYTFNPDSKKFPLFTQVGSEFLLNFGKEVTYHTFDQLRINVTLGVKRKKLTIQSGYMYRLVQTGPVSYVGNHTILCWVNHQIDWFQTEDSRK